MKKLTLPFVIFFIFSTSFAQTSNTNTLQRPRLVVGIVVDQMRWDYLYRYYDRFGSGGFKRLLEGFSCENTFINYLPSYTAVGHSTIFTGSVPAIDGIAGNDWIEQLTGRSTYCTSDSTVTPVGNANAADGKMSPRNLLVSTITDELRLATNFQSKVVGVSLKDRASILPAGHLGNAFWFDDATGNFITSTYYMKELPEWLNAFNAKRWTDKLVANGWNTLYPVGTYKESDPDNVAYEGRFLNETSSSFPHDMKSVYEKNKASFRQTPFGNTITLELAKEVLNAYQLGKGSATDFLTINCASTDYVGHMYGPNSIEEEDTYLRLDKDLASFFQLLDARVGKGQWLVFLTADHGAAHNIGFMQEHQLPADFWFNSRLADTLNKTLNAKFQAAALVRSVMNYQVNFDLGKITSSSLDFDAIKKFTVEFLQKYPGVTFAVDIAHIGDAPVPQSIKTMITNGYYFKRSGQVQVILNAGWFESYGRTGTTHGSWNPYDTHIPLLWYGWKIKPGRLNREVYMTDISATLAALLHIQMPNGCIGHVIEEIVK